MRGTGIRGELDKIKQNQKLLAIAVLLFVIAISWVGLSLFSARTSTVISAQQKRLAAPLQPVIKVEVIDQLSDQQYYSDEDLDNFTIYKLVRIDNRERRTAISIDTPISAFDEGAEESVPDQVPGSNFSDLLEEEEDSAPDEPTTSQPDANEPPAGTTDPAGPAGSNQDL